MSAITTHADKCSCWDAFVHLQAHSQVYHLAGWRNAIQSAYGHRAYSLVAATTSLSAGSGTETDEPCVYNLSRCVYFGKYQKVVGILPLIHIRHWLFGNCLASIPYFDSGGILAETKLAEQKLLSKAVQLAGELGATRIELRQNRQLFDCGGQDEPDKHDSLNAVDYVGKHTWGLSTLTNKVRMVLELPESADLLMKSFKTKLRSQIRKPLKEGLVANAGGLELVDDFYSVFATNMRDLGSPVHSKSFIRQVLIEFRGEARIFVVYGHGRPMACSLTVGFKQTLCNPWASSLRQYSSLAPNMLLYWSMLEFACERGYRAFDFGRSTVGEGTYRFKEQWGARPSSLYWYCLTPAGCSPREMQLEKNRMARAIEIWKQLPVPVTRVLGPQIRRYISL